MKSLILLGLFLSLINGQILGRSLTPKENLKLCFEDCVAFEEPGHALRACISKCQDRFEQALENAESQKYCIVGEPGCTRDDGDDGIPWYED